MNSSSVVVPDTTIIAYHFLYGRTLFYFVNPVPIERVTICNPIQIQITSQYQAGWTPKSWILYQTWALHWTCIGLNPDYDEFYWFWIASGLWNATCI